MEKTVTLQVPTVAPMNGKTRYQTFSWSGKVNSPLEVHKDSWYFVRWGGDEIYKNYLSNFEEEQPVGERIVTESGVEV